MILVEERSEAEYRNKKLIEERANLEEAISNMEQTSQVALEEHRLEKVPWTEACPQEGVFGDSH